MTRSKLPDLNGLLVIDKPAGMTSHDVVGRVRRLTGMKRVGHGGTLDPFATGILVVAVGRATRLLQYVQDSQKGYRAHVVLGASTDTADVDGVLNEIGDGGGWPGHEEVTTTVARFVGEIEQVPPAYSAIKVGGRKLYELARAGEDVEVPTRMVTIHTIDTVSYRPPDLILDIHCGKGTYVRSIARDIGVALGTEAYCHGLRRTNTGRFCLADAWTLDELTERDVRQEWPQIALHPDAALADLPAVVLGEGDQAAWYHGRSVQLSPASQSANAPVRAYGDDGRFLGIGTRTADNALKPSLVLPPEDEGEES
ncbi:MAG TPA: tRNA pseudouridine(55) synthase TruB [Thermomicrobiales bacterium]|nr:tRNA pseudouridine(55) synthase TruB [Thermomicrobiales bacterium]